MLRPGFADLCETTRSVIVDGKLFDLYIMTGMYGSNFSSKHFLKAPHNYGVMLNIDWFQSFKHHSYSVGVIYLVLMNLPRAVRYKRENILLVGIIPGPSEPPLNINRYLSPLVDDLLKL